MSDIKFAKTYITLSEFYGKNKLKADVVRSTGEDHVFGIRMYDGDVCLGLEWYEGRSESYAESAAENYVEGIKKYERSDGLE